MLSFQRYLRMEAQEMSSSSGSMNNGIASTGRIGYVGPIINELLLIFGRNA
jgi:hypothetical protein